MDQDLAPLLNAWPYDPEHAARKIAGADGREKVQLRVRVGTYHGIVQLESDGRPDGERPHGAEFALDFHEERQRAATAGGLKFSLDHRAAHELFDEGTLVYERYVVLLQLGDWERVIRDTERNIRLFRFVHRWAERAEDREHLEKWWPYILRINAMARIERARAAGDFNAALAVLHEARQRIAELPEQEDETFRVERERSRKALSEIEQVLELARPLDEVERLEREKRAAVRRQEYERAAALRDRISALRQTRDAAPDAAPAAPPDPPG
jgi:hypothetical protein